MKRIVLIIVTVLISFTGLHSQDNYYWNYGRKEYMDYYPNKKYIVVDSSITSKTELASALNDTSLKINTFQESSVLIHLNIYDSTAYEKQYAILQSRDSINESEQLNNQVVNYVGPYYIRQGSGDTVGISKLFYVKLYKTSDITLLDSIANSNNVSILGNDSDMPLIYTLECSNQSTGNALDMANLFYESTYFEHSTPSFTESFNYLNTFECVNDFYFDQQWGLENTTEYYNIDINACDAWEYTKGNSDIIIAVLDSGVKLDHEDLSINAQIGWDIETETSPSDIYFDEEEYKVGNYNHGTNCAGIIAAQHNEIGVAGIAPDCEIMPISYNFYNYDNPEIRLAKGINYAWQNGADILSCSWRSGQHLYIDNAINNAITNGRNGLGTVVVVASGNYNNSTVDYPSVLPGVISVGAINMCGTRCVGWHTEYNPEDSLMQDCFNYWWPMEFGSNYGDHLSVVAPGIKVPTTNIVDNNWNTDKYITVFRGTSAAAPHVSGVAALLLSMRTDLTYTEVKDAIESTAQKIRTDFYDYNVSKPNGMWNEKLGYGLVDAYNAIMELCTNQTSIGSGQNITWDETTFVCDDLEIEGTLTIDAGVYFLTEEPVITVKSGGHLKIDDGNFYLYDGLDYNGEIVVNAGGSIELLSASELTIGGTGSILIENSSATNGTLTYNNEATLTLADDDTYLEIEGELEIGDNSTFTFSGDGYIKFSKPGNDLETQDNIIAGTNASFVLEGTGKNDKKMEIQQSTVHFPELAELRFEDCKIEMGAGSTGLGARM